MQLQVGMNIYCDEWSDSTRITKYTITRVTPTQAIVEAGRVTLRFPRESNGHFLSPKGVDQRWGHRSYYLETPEWMEKYERALLLSRIAHVDFKTLSTPLLQRIFDEITAELNAKPVATKE